MIVPKRSYRSGGGEDTDSILNTSTTLSHGHHCSTFNSIEQNTCHALVSTSGVYDHPSSTVQFSLLHFSAKSHNIPK